MRLAIALFGEEISPRFDCCAALAILDSAAAFTTAERLCCGTPDGERRLNLLLSQKVELLLCGGLRRCDWFRLEAQGIGVLAGFQGQADELFAAYQEGRLPREAPAEVPQFGCQHRRHRQGKGE